MIRSKRVGEAVEKDNLYPIKCLQEIFSSESGKVALLWLLEKVDFFTASPDPVIEAQNAGKRILIGELLRELKIDLNELVVTEEPLDLLDKIIEE